MMEIEELQEFLNKSSIPISQKAPKTFLEIARQPHYENVISNIYGFFFDVNEEHGLKDLFINALIACIQETEIGKKKTFDEIHGFTIDLEYSTEKNGRIDILLSSENSAIIIENKIYHGLNNNLEDYWASVINAQNEADKTIGVVLSIAENVNVGHPQFIHLTHIKLLDQIMHNIGEYIIGASDKYFIFLKDFYQNIKNLSQKNMKQEDLSFVLDNIQKINQITEIDNGFKSFVKNEVEKACKYLDGFKLTSMRSGSYNERRLRYFESQKISDLCFTVLFDGLFLPQPRLSIFIEVWGKRLRELQSLMPLTEEDNFPKSVQVESDFTGNKNNWAHFCSVTFLLSKEDVYDLSGFIINKLEETKFLDALNCLEMKLLKNEELG